MNEIVPTPAVPIANPTPTNPTPIAPEPNPAVAWCRQAYAQAFQASKSQGSSQYEAERHGADAYRKAMPPLCGAENIRNFIACVARAMLTEMMNGADATRLLYAAQVAQAAIDRPAPGKPGRPKSQPPPEN
jgi:hypothetical protein